MFVFPRWMDGISSIDTQFTANKTDGAHLNHLLKVTNKYTPFTPQEACRKKTSQSWPQVGRIFPVLDGKIKPLIQRDPLEDADSKDTRILVTCHFFYSNAVGGCKNKNIRRAFHDHHGNLVSSRNFEWSKSFLLQCCRQIHKPRCTKWKFCFVSNLNRINPWPVGRFTVDGFRVFVFIMPLTGTAWRVFHGMMLLSSLELSMNSAKVIHQTSPNDIHRYTKIVVEQLFYTLLKLLCFSEHVWASLLDVYHKNHVQGSPIILGVPQPAMA